MEFSFDASAEKRINLARCLAHILFGQDARTALETGKICDHLVGGRTISVRSPFHLGWKRRPNNAVYAT
ncbi:hypothetical protein PIN31115_03650 [Pandoraea iniqua]|uniref:Uncharacterized protein n=1 Tax=Pandoraea iniqua TaxID=2508288 RepID=A0A5E4X5K2_9BURK|nr:hypothetical protein PIN31115_03650 [Pandoraea iniqua]